MIQKVSELGDRCRNWRNKNISIDISIEIAKMEGINNIQVIDNRKVKASNLTEEYLEEIKKHLPSKPWPKNVSYDVAKKMNISRKEANIVIGELIKRKMV